ncbi:MAG: hypothetical protein KQJ78_03705 [Deltaproteobacteria bacterium]|nr:hypothetical protein [Deltaproteobacteria bacterium]
MTEQTCAGPQAAEAKEPTCSCPLGSFFRHLDESLGGESPFRQHMKNAEAELLKAMRALIDQRLAEHEKPRKKATRITVEEG